MRAGPGGTMELSFCQLWGPWGLVLILAAFLKTKPSRGVLVAMRFNKQFRTQQSKASGAGNIVRYGHFV